MRPRTPPYMARDKWRCFEHETVRQNIETAEQSLSATPLHLRHFSGGCSVERCMTEYEGHLRAASHSALVNSCCCGVLASFWSRGVASKSWEDGKEGSRGAMRCLKRCEGTTGVAK
jgi:hypothetical protein